jgi:hypothetical protein
MPIQKLILPPDKDGYSFLDPKDILSVDLDGGASKFRKDILNGTFRLSVQWTLTPEQYNYMRVFYKVVLENGSLPFNIDLYVDNPYTLTTHECHFLPGTFGLKSQKGLAFVLGATLEVKPIALDAGNISAAYTFGGLT